MIKSVFLLVGLCTFLVVCNHAGAWAQTAMFWWTDSYRPVSVPNYDQLGSITYYVVLVVRQLAVFSVPGFLFASGYFAAYAFRRGQSGGNREIVWARLVSLVVPYLIWSVIVLVIQAIEAQVYTARDVLTKLMLGGAHRAYFYVPLLCQFYLLAPWLVSAARQAPKRVLVFSALIQLVIVVLSYLVVLADGWMVTIARTLPAWLFARWVFYFPFGVVCYLNSKWIGRQLLRFRWGILMGTVVAGIATVVEPLVIRTAVGLDGQSNPFLLSSTLYSVLVVLCILAFPQVLSGVTRYLKALGTRSYGVYLVHPMVLEFVSRLVRRVTPRLLENQVLFLIMLVGLGIGLPFVLMTAISRSSLRKAYRYLFG